MVTEGATGDRRHAPDRRIRRVAVWYPERRTGFPRRRPKTGGVRAAWLGMLHAYRTRPRVIALVIVTFAALNVADLVLTLRALRLGATEANPVMAALFDADPVAAAVVKLALTAGVGIALWSLRRYRRILETSLVLVAVFAAVLGYHAAGALLLAG